MYLLYMANPVEDQGNEQFTSAANDSNYNLDRNRTSNANGFIAGSDFHGKYSSIKNLYSIAQARNLDVLLNGDVVNDSAFNEFANALGYKSANDIFIEYAQTNLSERDYSALILMRNLQQTGGSLDPFLQQVPDQHKAQAKQQLESIIQEIKSDEVLGKRIEKTIEKFNDEKQEEVIYNTIRLNALYYVFMDKEAKKLAETINEYDITTHFNLGNHENAYFVSNVRKYLDDPSKIIDLTNHEGYVTINQENGQNLTLAGMTNCVMPMKYLPEVVGSPDEYQFLTSHMEIDSIKEQSLMQGFRSKEELDSLESIIDKDKDKQRIGEGNGLDVFISHGQIGKVYLDENREGFDVPYMGVAAYFSSKAQLTIEGHIHSKFDGKNSFGDDMVRAAGEESVIVYKDINGNLQKEWVKIDDNFDGNHHNPINYNIEEMKAEVEALVKQREIAMQQNSIEDKAA